MGNEELLISAGKGSSQTHHGAPQAPDREYCHSEAQISLLLWHDGNQE